MELNKNLETRQNKTECRAIETDGKRSIEGYALLYDHESRQIYERGQLFTEVIKRGALDEIMTPELDVIYTPNHDFSKVIARTTSGTLKLVSDERGLKYVVEDIPNISYANDIFESIKRGDTFESSFTFALNNEDQNWSEKEDGETLRTISKISYLKEVSSVTDGAYSNTDVAVRSLNEFLKVNEKDESYLIDLELKEKELEILKIKK